MRNLGSSTLDSSPALAAGTLDQRLSFDVQGVDGLRHTARTSPQEGLKQASRQFEALFMQMVLKSMRDATPSDGLLDSQQAKVYTSMLDQQLAQSLSGRGLGLADAMQAQLQRSIGTLGTPPSAATRTNAANSIPQPGTTALTQTAGASVARQPTAAVPPADTDLTLYEQATAQATMSRSVYSQEHVEQFVTRLLPAAQRASEQSGIPAQVIMAQAALESGWGRREARADDGRPSFNLFGIKADKSWSGPVVEANTTEYVNGVAKNTRARFRAYASYEDGFSDYARFLHGNPRYHKVLATQDPSEVAMGLQQAGYATDPQYGGKLIRIMKQML